MSKSFGGFIDWGAVGYRTLDNFNNVRRNYEQDKTKLQHLDDLITKNSKDFDDIKKFEKKIYTTLSPMVKNMQNDMNKIQNSLSKQSKAALNVNSQISKMSDNFSTEFGESIGHLLGVMDLLIKIYEIIQESQQDKKSANFIAGLHSDQIVHNDVQKPIGEAAVDEAILKLETLIRSNSLIEQYCLSIELIKQYVFPHANYYLNDVTLPKNLAEKFNSSELTRKIDNINENLNKYSNDHYSGYGAFDLDVG